MNVRAHPPATAGQAGEPLPEFCARYHRAVELIGSRWTGSVLRTLIAGPHNYNAILATVPGLSDRLLTERLRTLESEGLVMRTVQAGPPVRVVYELTEQGRDLEPVIRAVAVWAERWLPVERS